MNASMNASPFPAPAPLPDAGSPDGRGPAGNPDAGRLGQDFQRLLRDRMDARREQDSKTQDLGFGAESCLKPEADSSPPPLSDLRNLVGERRFEHHDGRQERPFREESPRATERARSLFGNAPSIRPSDGPTQPSRPSSATCIAEGEAGTEDADSLHGAGMERVGPRAEYGRRGRHGGHGGPGGDESGEGVCRESPGNEALQRPELLGARAPAFEAVFSSSRPAAATPDPRDTGATRAAVEAALTTPLSTPESRAAATWEVSLPQRSGGALEMQASRTQPSTGAATWTLDIRSGARELTSTLARNASRLSDRLEARSLPSHVRIERDDEAEEQ